MAAESDKDVELVAWAQGKVRQHTAATDEWRTDATDAYAVVAGNQWDEQVKNELEADSRPVFTFNRVAGFIRGICGLETSTRNQVQFYGRELNDSGQADVVNGAVSYVREGCDADDEESDAFKDMLICGLGFTETFYTTEESPEGDIIVERVDPLHMAWDPSSRKRGMADRRWIARKKWLPKSTIEDIWGKKLADEVGSVPETDSDISEDLAGSVSVSDPRHAYEGDNPGNSRVQNGVLVVQLQYVKTCHYYSVTNPMTGQVEELEESDYNQLNKRLKKEKMPQLEGERIKHRQYRQAIYSGDTLLEDEEMPCKCWTLNVITGVRDRNNGTWYGFVRDLLDPQRWINKFFSSMADVVASQAKGGLLAEVDAFVNKENAQDDWANPRSIVWLKRDGLGKIKERTSAGVPAGISQLLDFTVQSLPDVAGVNLEFLGMAGREQPGVLEHQRKQAAISTMAEFFNALRLYRKQQGRCLVLMIGKFINDGRLIRIVGKQNAEYVPLSFDAETLKYDIVVDEAPNSPNQKDQTWQALMQILPAAASLGMPIPPEVIQYAPFPQALIQDWMKFTNGESGGSPQQKAQIQQMQEQMGALQKENQGLKSKQQETMAKIQADQQESQAKLQQSQQEGAAQLQLQQQKLQAEMQLKREQLQAEMAFEMQKMQMQNELERQRMGLQAQTQLDVAAMQAATQPAPVAPEPKTDGATKEIAAALKALAAPKTVTSSKGTKYTITTGKDK